MTFQHTHAESSVYSVHSTQCNGMFKIKFIDAQKSTAYGKTHIHVHVHIANSFGPIDRSDLKCKEPVQDKIGAGLAMQICRSIYDTWIRNINVNSHYGLAIMSTLGHPHQGRPTIQTHNETILIDQCWHAESSIAFINKYMHYSFEFKLLFKSLNKKRSVKASHPI